MYFPQPRTLGSRSKMGYDGIYLLAVKIFHKSSSNALLKAEEIATQIRKNKYTIQLLNEDGSTTDEKIRFKKIECSVVAENAAVINLEWDEFYHYD